MINYIAQYGRALVDNGFYIVPVQAGGKAPAVLQGGQWKNLKEWDRYARRQPSDIELRIWSNWTAASVGVMCGFTVVVDIDCRDPANAAKMEAAAREILGDTQLKRVGQVPKMALIYRSEVEMAGRKHHPVEVLGKGNQFVAYGIHPDTQQPYYWPDETLADVDHGDLIAVTPEQIDAFLVRATEIEPPAASLSSPVSSPDARLTSPWGLEGTPEAVADALAHIPNDDLNYDDWLRVGLAVKAAAGEAGRDLWLDWSAPSSKDVPAYTADKWDRHMGDVRSVGAGTIYRLAMDRGWTPPPGVDLNPLAAAPPITVNLARKAKPPAPRAEPEDVLPPDFLAEAPATIRAVAGWIAATATKPQPELALANTLAAFGALFGRRYESETGILTNLYVVGLAGTAGGKDHSRRQIKRLFSAVGCADRIGSDNIISSAGLLQEVAQRLSLLMNIDEFGHVLEAMNADKSGEAKKIARNLLMLYSDAQSTYNGGTYADPRLRQNTIIVHPCLSIYGTSTPQSYFDALSIKAVQGGELNRFLVVPATTENPPRQKPDVRGVPDGLVEAVQALSVDRRVKTGNLQDTPPSSAPAPFVTVGMDDDAYAVLEGTEKMEDGNVASGFETAPLWGRLVENTTKIAMVAAITENPETPVISKQNWLWAESIVAWVIRRMCRDVDRFVHDGPFDRLCSRILETVRNKGGEITLTQLAQARVGRSVTQRERNEALNALAEMEKITIEKEEKKRGAVVIRLSGG